MEIDFDQVFYDVEPKGRNPLKRITMDEDGNRGSDEIMTLGWVASQALLAFETKCPRCGSIIAVDQTDGTKKAARYDLSMKIFRGGKVDLETDEIALIKKLIGKKDSTLIVGQCWPILKCKGDKEKSKGKDSE